MVLIWIESLIDEEQEQEQEDEEKEERGDEDWNLVLRISRWHS
jgi:hypothetical protein